MQAGNYLVIATLQFQFPDKASTVMFSRSRVVTLTEDKPRSVVFDEFLRDMEVRHVEQFPTSDGSNYTVFFFSIEPE